MDSSVYLLGFGISVNSDGKVKMNSADALPGYLEDKIDGSTIISSGGVLSANVTPIESNVYKTFDCDVAAAVGNVVTISETVDDFVDVAADNRTDFQVVGIITEKPTGATAKVLLDGIYPVVHTLEPGRVIYVGTSGELTNDRPATGYVHIVGIVLDSGNLYISPNLTRVRITPF